MLPEPRCFTRNCVHYFGVKWLGPEENSEAHVCNAFPDGIPNEIAYGDNLHLKPFPGDRGIQFEEDIS